MSMWLQDIEQMNADELEGLCEELEMKLDEGRKELTRKEEHDDSLGTDCPCAICVEMAHVHNAAMEDSDE